MNLIGPGPSLSTVTSGVTVLLVLSLIIAIIYFKIYFYNKQKTTYIDFLNDDLDIDLDDYSDYY